MEVLISYDDSAIRKRFLQFEKQCGSGRVALVEVAELIAERNEATWGRGVTELAIATLESKAEKGQTDEPLIATGEMKRDLTDPKRGIRVLTDYELLFGTNKFYALFTQYGTLHQPRRRVLRFTPTTRKAASAILMKHIMREA